MRLIEIISLKLDSAPWNAVSRMLLGLILVPSWELLCRRHCPPWMFVFFFFAVLLALRAGPLVVRKALPFSRDAQAVWKSRRRLATIYDSYQWRKLFWMGLGIAFCLKLAGHSDPYMFYLAGVCICGGAIGLMTWLIVSRRLSPVPVPQ
jgi:hypothetical protein